MPSKRAQQAAGKNIPYKVGRRQLMQMLMGGWFAASARGSRPATGAEEKRRGRFGFAAVKKLARDLAQRPFQEPAPLPDALRRLTYDQYRLIAFRHERALWRDPPLPFRVEFHHRGFVSKDKVDIVL